MSPSDADRSRPGRPAPDPPDPLDLDVRKERVLHTRVPESLERQLKRRARSLGMSVSTVVRHVLLNTFGLVEAIVTDGTNVALALTGQDTSPLGERGPTAAAVLGWQEAVLNLNAVCERCNAVLHKGSRAAIGVRDGPGPRAVICRRCLGTLAGSRRAPAARPRR